MKIVQRWCVFLTFIFTFLISNSHVSASEGDWTGNINVFLGAKALDDEEWAPTEDQGEVGIELDFKNKNWPFSIAIDYLKGSGDGKAFGVNWESETTELNVGAKKIWDNSPQMRPFVGAGLSIIEGEFSGLGVSDNDSGIGIWLDGGVYWTLAEHLNLGLEAKISSANITLFGVDANAGGGHFGALVGFHW